MPAISSSKSNTLEPLKKNRWFLQFTSIPGSSDSKSQEALSFCAHTAARPQQTFNAITSHRINEQHHTAGKVTWADLPVSFYDFINGKDSASQIIWDWSKLVYDPITGQQGFKTQYSTSATLAMLDPNGGVVQLWNIFYIWPLDVNYNDLSSEDDGLAEVAVTFKYDYAIKGTDVNTSPNA